MSGSVRGGGGTEARYNRGHGHHEGIMTESESRAAQTMRLSTRRTPRIPSPDSPNRRTGSRAGGEEEVGWTGRGSEQHFGRKNDDVVTVFHPLSHGSASGSLSPPAGVESSGGTSWSISKTSPKAFVGARESDPHSEKYSCIEYVICSVMGIQPSWDIWAMEDIKDVQVS